MAMLPIIAVLNSGCVFDLDRTWSTEIDAGLLADSRPTDSDGADSDAQPTEAGVDALPDGQPADAGHDLSLDMTLPDATPAPDTKPSGPSTLFVLDFEKSNGGLKGTKDWDWAKIAFKAGKNCDSKPTPPKSGHSGMGVWGTRVNDCYSALNNAATADKKKCTNQVPADDSILNIKLTVPATYKSAALVFWEWRDIFYPYDWNEIRIVDGGVPSVAQQDCYKAITPPTKWAQRKVNLTKYIGKTISVQFHFMASSVVNYAGWYIDDLSLQVTQ